MVFGNLTTGVEIFQAYSNGTYTPDRTYTLVDTIEGKGVSNIYYYGLYKVEFEDGSEPEWRIHGEDSPLTDDDGEARPDYDIVFQKDSPMVNISTGLDDDGMDFYAPYISTYTTEDEAKKALKDSIPILGCRDTAANNYDYTATMDDGSCSYDEESGSMMPLLVIGGIAAVILLM